MPPNIVAELYFGHGYDEAEFAKRKRLLGTLFVSFVLSTCLCNLGDGTGNAGCDEGFIYT